MKRSRHIINTITKDQLRNVVEMNAVTEHKVSPPIHEQVAKEMMENGSVVIGIRRSLTTRVLTTR